MSAIISPCGLYRYRLERRLEETGLTIMWLMVNPSTADATLDDPTIRKCMGFARRLGGGLMLVGNLFAFRATDVAQLRGAADPIGPENDAHLLAMMQQADMVIAGWGALNKLPEVLQGRWKDVVRMADAGNVVLHCIGTNADKHPKHPLMTGYEVPVTEWQVPWFANRRAA